jgi:hypothetical protein
MENNKFGNLASHIRRRLNPENLKYVLNTIMEYDVTPCSYDDIGEFVSSMCDTLKDVFLDNISMEFPVEITPKDKDDVYYYFVNLFGKYLVNEHKKLCSDKSTNESIINWEAWKKVNGEKNKIIITESQFFRLFEDVKPKKTKQETFQKLIDNNLEYIKNYCNSNQAIYESSVGIATCNVVDMINSIKITDLQMMSSAGTDMHGNLKNVTPSIHIKLLVNFTSHSFVDFDEVIYDLKHMLRQATGMLIIFDYDQENSVTNRQW